MLIRWLSSNTELVLDKWDLAKIECDKKHCQRTECELAYQQLCTSRRSVQPVLPQYPFSTSGTRSRYCLGRDPRLRCYTLLRRRGFRILDQNVLVHPTNPNRLISYSFATMFSRSNTSLVRCASQMVSSSTAQSRAALQTRSIASQMLPLRMHSTIRTILTNKSYARKFTKFPSMQLGPLHLVLG